MWFRYLLWGTVVMFSMGVTACSSVDYVYNDTLLKKGLISEQDFKSDKEKKRDSLFYIPKMLGGVKVKDSSAPGGERFFLIKRDKSSIVAETQIYEGNYKYFDRAYFSLGASASDYIGMQFRFENDDKDAKRLFEKARLNIGANKKKGMVGLELAVNF